MTELSALTADLKKPDATVRARAAEQLAHLAEDAAPAAVALVEALGDVDDTVRDWANAALESVGPPSADDAVKLAALASDLRLNVAYWAVTLLGRLGAADELPADGSVVMVSVLTSELQSHPEIAVRERAAWALGQIGKPAASALTALQQAAGDSRPRLSRLAKEALDKI
jgi:HEAT repeat protein